jgi:hypothetical protein
METSAVRKHDDLGRRGLRPYLWVPVLASAVAWGVVFLAVPPSNQDFPLNDDWAFARGAFEFARDGEVHYFGWASMPQLGQWLWAWPFVSLFGDHHQVLRVSTILLSWTGLIAFGDLVYGYLKRPWLAAAVGTALAFHPLFFLLAGTFMTDVPALSFALVSLALYDRGFSAGSARLVAAGAGAATLGAITRQNTLAAPLAVGLVWLGAKRSAGSWVGALAVALPLAVGIGAHLWFQQRPDTIPFSPRLPAPQTPPFVLFVLLHFLGLSCIPILAMGRWPLRSRVFWLVLVAMAAAAFYYGTYGFGLPYGPLYPYTCNVLSPHGAFEGSRVPGPVVPGHRPLLLGDGPRLALTGLGCVAAAMLAARASELERRSWAHPLLLFSLIQVPMMMTLPALYDRYFLPLLPGALFVAAAAL